MFHLSDYLQQVNSASYRRYYPAIKLRAGKRNIVVERLQLTELLFLHILSQKENFAYFYQKANIPAVEQILSNGRNEHFPLRGTDTFHGWKDFIPAFKALDQYR